MALDFPASPTNGQLDSSGQWTYNSTKQAWQAVPLTQVKTVTSPTPPSTPANGDQWFNTNDGTLYIYYIDANSSQWVESRAPITADGYISPNYVINGAFDFWQRSTSATAPNGNYNSADRWWMYYNSGTTTFSREGSVVPANFTYALKMSQATATGSMVVYQFLETSDSKQLAGKTVTLSMYLASTAALQVTPQLRWSSTVDATYAATWTNLSPSVATWSVPSGSTYARYTATYMVPSNISSISLGFNPNNMTAGSSLYIAGIQLEEGTTATPFRRNSNSVADEFATCQRYYQLIGKGTLGRWTSATFGEFFLRLPVQMRVSPTLTVLGQSVFYNVGLASGGYTFTVGGDFTSTGGQLTPTLAASIGGSFPNHGAIMSDAIGASAEL